MHKGDSGGDGMNALAVRSDPSYSYILLWDICLNGIIRRLWAGQPNCKRKLLGAGLHIKHSLWISDTESSTAIKPMADPFHYSIGRPNFNKATDEIPKPNLTKENHTFEDPDVMVTNSPLSTFP